LTLVGQITKEKNVTTLIVEKTPILVQLFLAYFWECAYFGQHGHKFDNLISNSISTFHSTK
jgi:ABC-type amino acid transport system permease subunit